MTMPPSHWGRLLGGLHTEAFRRKVHNCDDVERLRAAQRHEDQRHGDTRPKRIALLNERIEKLKQS